MYFGTASAYCLGFGEIFKAYRLLYLPPGLKLKNSTWLSHCIYVFCVALRTNSNICFMHHWQIDFYNRAGECLQRGTHWVLIHVSHELRSLLRESVPDVKPYRYNPKHVCPKLNGYGDNGQRKVLTSCISAYCTSSAVSAVTLTEQCSTHLCDCTSSAQRDKIVLHYCQIFMLYTQCLVTLRTIMTWVRVFL